MYCRAYPVRTHPHTARSTRSQRPTHSPFHSHPRPILPTATHPFAPQCSAPSQCAGPASPRAFGDEVVVSVQKIPRAHTHKPVHLHPRTNTHTHTFTHTHTPFNPLQCIKSLCGPRKPASIGDEVVVSVQKTKMLPSTQAKQSVKKGEVRRGIIVRCRVCPTKTAPPSSPYHWGSVTLSLISFRVYVCVRVCLCLCVPQDAAVHSGPSRARRRGRSGEESFVRCRVCLLLCVSLLIILSGSVSLLQGASPPPPPLFFSSPPFSLWLMRLRLYIARVSACKHECVRAAARAYKDAAVCASISRSHAHCTVTHSADSRWAVLAHRLRNGESMAAP